MTGSIKRIVPKYKEWVVVPEEFRAVIWDAFRGESPLEEMVYKILLYGKFHHIRRAYELYPEVVKHVAFSYPEIHRGVRYWVRKWSG